MDPYILNDNCNDTCAGSVYYHSTSQRLVVWYNNVAHWSSDGYENSYYDFQVIIYNDNAIDINIKSIEGNYSATVGMQNQSGTIYTQVDQYNGSYFGDTTSFKFVKQFSNSWLSLFANNGNLSGSLFDGENVSISINVDANELPLGEFDAQIDISTNAGDIVIPVNLTVSSESGLLGDLNGDNQININDIITLVNFIIDGQYNYNGDLNQDGSNNVVDIIQLVNIILGN